MKERLPDRNRIRTKREGIDRRSFLGGALAMLAAQAAFSGGAETMARMPEIENFLKERAERMRFDHWNTLSAPEREEHIEAETTKYADLVRSPEGRRILEQGTDEEIFNLLYLAPPILREHLIGTKYDIPEDKWPSVVIPLATESDSQAPMFRSLPEVSQAEVKASGYGNGVFVGERTLLTNWHVMEDRIHDPGSDIRVPEAVPAGYKRGIDAVYVRIAKENSRDLIAAKLAQLDKPEVLPLSSLSDSDVNGKFVVIAGIDPDASAGKDGTKIYPSSAIRVTKRLGQFVARNNPWVSSMEASPWVENSFLYFAPPGESILRRPPSTTGSRALDSILGEEPKEEFARMQGTSGSPALLDGQLVGINQLCGEIEFRGRCLDVGFFHGPDVLREAKELGMVLDE